MKYAAAIVTQSKTVIKEFANKASARKYVLNTYRDLYREGKPFGTCWTGFFNKGREKALAFVEEQARSHMEKKKDRSI